MGAGSIRRVAVVGDGPAGTTLAALLSRAGVRVALFARGRPAGLVVGESLVPAVVPTLRRLGIEERVAAFSTHKPGATFVVREGDSLAIEFAQACTSIPGYAYNVPRDRFDSLLQEVAIESGAALIHGSAQLVRGATGGLTLAAHSLKEASSRLSGAPDFVVDATGRSRAGARLLGLPADTGPRRDDALFAHWEGVAIEREGHVHSDRLEHGWCWRIPLPGIVSLGVVVRPEIVRAFGADACAQYEGFVRSDSHLAKLTASARRVSDVVRYSNYQLTARRGVGPRWALVGDAFGFVDPVFSSGLFLAMRGAEQLARALLAGTPRALRSYERRQRRHLDAWRGAVDTFYDGRFFGLLRLRGERPRRGAKRWVHDHVTRHVPRIFTGEGTEGIYAPRLLRFVADHALSPGEEPTVD